MTASHNHHKITNIFVFIICQHCGMQEIHVFVVYTANSQEQIYQSCSDSYE
jgi:hypothetical protein